MVGAVKLYAEKESSVTIVNRKLAEQVVQMMSYTLLTIRPAKIPLLNKEHGYL